MAIRIQLRRGTAAEWTAANPTLLPGEVGVETDTGKLKIGDGSTQWNSLAYSPGGPPGADGVGVPAGGLAGQALVKVDSTDYSTTWANVGNVTSSSITQIVRLTQAAYNGLSTVDPNTLYIIVG